MNIEFHAPQGKVKEWVLDYVRDKLIELHRRVKELTRAEVRYREQPDGSRVCKITLTIYGDSIFVHRQADSFEQASKEVLQELADKINELTAKHNDPPDEITSTVKV